MAAIASAVLAVGLAACGGEDGDGGYPTSKLTVEEASEPLANAKPELSAIREQANELLDGGLPAFEERLAELEGIPVVVNKWASWCGPCIYEFPHFQEAAIARGDEVAFLGIDFEDGEDAAATFLSRLPVPYPSYLDPDSKLSRAIEADYPPTTVFIGADGEVTHKKIGPYDTAEDLLADIDQYAR